MDPELQAGWLGEARPDRRPRRNFIARTLGALMVALLAFSGTVWVLTGVLREDPRDVVAAELQALSRGDIAGAYRYFSDSYRAGVSYEAFRHLVAIHRPLFRPRQVRFAHHAISGDRAHLELFVTTDAGTDYPVEYQLVRERGAWRIEDFRFHLDRSPDPNHTTEI